LAAGVVCALGGCGTLVNLANEGDPAPEMKDLPTGLYGGVRADAQLGKSYFRETFSGKYPGWASIYGFSVGSYLLGVDMPLSMVGDTVTLPWSVVVELTAPPPSKPSAKDQDAQGHGEKPRPTAEPAASEAEE
jgi:uncharacterized protein YceK